jgi:uroporphyrinogen-III decarboxylase
MKLNTEEQANYDRLSTKMQQSYKAVRESLEKDPTATVTHICKNTGINPSHYYNARLTVEGYKRRTDLAKKERITSPLASKQMMKVVEIPEAPQEKVLAFYCTPDQLRRLLNG